MEIYDPQDEAGTSFVNVTNMPTAPKNKVLVVRTSINLNWATGRYTMHKSFGGRSDVIPPQSTSGKCELINPKD